ncbi:MAG: acetate--CoA ligase family protein [Pseudomonadota bacterium]
MKRFERLLAPKRLAVIGGGAWCDGIVGAARALGFSGEITPVHPTRKSVAGLRAVSSVADISGRIDAAFIGVNRDAAIGVMGALSALGAGGAVCFASGFSEEDGGAAHQAALLDAAGDMPFLGPNCYGLLNAFDGAAIWPDQHGLRRTERGVAILTQSSNIAINLTMQRRALPIGYVVTCGNQAQIRQAVLARALLDDPRVTAIGLHIEGFGDLREWEALAAAARARGIPLVAIKAGRSSSAREAALSHTASLAGEDAGADALLARLGIARVESPEAFIEALKIAHLFGRLPGRGIASISCSGGEAALVADMAEESPLAFPPLSDRQREDLCQALGPRVTLSNPLDYHTYIWRDLERMTAAWAAMADPRIALTLVILDYPRSDLCSAHDWDIATQAVIAAARQTGGRYAVCASLPENLPEDIAQRLLAAGVLPLHGLDAALRAITAMTAPVGGQPRPLLLPGQGGEDLLSEADAKHALAAHGVPAPAGCDCARQEAGTCATTLSSPLAIKVLGIAHKTEAKAVALDVAPQEIAEHLTRMAPGPRVLIEEMVEGGVAELLLGVVRDEAHGFLMTVAAGGVFTEIMEDRASFLIPESRPRMEEALRSLRAFPLLTGYRGKEAASLPAILDAMEAVQAYVVAHAETLSEIEINPLICTPTSAIAADALIRKARP